MDAELLPFARLPAATLESARLGGGRPRIRGGRVSDDASASLSFSEAMSDYLELSKGLASKPASKPGSKPASKPGSKPGSKPESRAESDLESDEEVAADTAADTATMAAASDEADLLVADLLSSSKRAQSLEEPGSDEAQLEELGFAGDNADEILAEDLIADASASASASDELGMKIADMSLSFSDTVP